MKRTEALTELIPGEDLYMENGLIVMTAVHHKNVPAVAVMVVNGAPMNRSMSQAQHSSLKTASFGRPLTPLARYQAQS